MQEMSADGAPGSQSPEATAQVQGFCREFSSCTISGMLFLCNSAWTREGERAGSAARAPHPAPQCRLQWHGQAVPVGPATWTEYTLLSERLVVPLAKEVATDVTAIIGCAVLTGAGVILHTLGVRVNESVAVFGAGGVGLCAIATAHIVGAYPIIAVDLSDDKLAFAQRFGATHGVNAAHGDPVQAI